MQQHLIYDRLDLNEDRISDTEYDDNGLADLDCDDPGLCYAELEDAFFAYLLNEDPIITFASTATTPLQHYPYPTINISLDAVKALYANDTRHPPFTTR